MKIILIDDEKSMLLIMKKMISNIPETEVTGVFQSTSLASSFLRDNHVDMIFVDINMPEESGIDFVRRVTSEIKNMIIVFLTAHKDYALEAFEVQAFDYLVKPISLARLENTIQRARLSFAYYRHQEEKISLHRLFIYCFGGLDVKSEKGNQVQFSSSKSAELFAYLLLKKGRLISKWSIIEDIFGGMPLHNAEIYLNTTVYKLRKALTAFDMKNVIICTAESYKIDLKYFYVDFIDFESQISNFQEINSLNYEAAIKTEMLYNGELFGVKDYIWCLPDKERYSGAYLSFAAKLVTYSIESNQLTKAMLILKKMEVINEIHEEVNSLLMRVYAAQRDRLSLERQYLRYEKKLRKELGVNPEIKFSNLYRALLKSMD